MHGLPDPQCTPPLTQLYYEHYGTRLKDEIEARKRYRERFEEPEVWYIIYSIIKAVRMFEKANMCSGNLKTDKVLLNEKGHLKVLNLLSFPEDSSGPGVQRFFGTYALMQPPRSSGPCESASTSE